MGPFWHLQLNRVYGALGLDVFVAFTVFVLFMECFGWIFMKFTAFVAFNLVKCNLTNLTTTSLAVKRFTSLAVKRFSSLAV